MGFLKKHVLTIFGVLAGAVAGYLYYNYVGCYSSTCPITSVPLNSTLYGGLMGGLFLNIFEKGKNKTDKKGQNEQQ